jgi:hypothetical protein
MAGLIGAEMPDDRIIDGLDIWPVITEGAATPHDYFYYSMANEAIRNPEFKLMNGQLFNLNDDISETTDLSGDMPALASQLQGKLDSMRADVAATRRPMVNISNVPQADRNPRDPAAPVFGCMDTAYFEYDANADVHDYDSCATLIVHGCTDSSYEEYNPDANVNDSSACVTLGLPDAGLKHIVREIEWRRGSVTVRVPHEIRVRSVAGDLLFRQTKTGEATWILSHIKHSGMIIITIKTTNGIYTQKRIRF